MFCASWQTRDFSNIWHSKVGLPFVNCFWAIKDALAWILGEVDAEDFILDIVSTFHDQVHFGLTFSIPPADFYTTLESCGAKVTYQHGWMENGTFDIQISLRAEPLLPINGMALRHERYFEWLGIEPPIVPSLDLHEILGEKIRAAMQRNRVRDLYDLHQLSSQRFDRDKVRRIAVIKCWETRFAFAPTALLSEISSGNYNWSDLYRLVRRGWDVSPDMIVNAIRKEYAFLNELTEEEVILATDAYCREQKVYSALVNRLRSTMETSQHPE
jgi:hypothetical protein